MKVAVISDIHGNMRALESVLDDLEHQHVDQLICAGDTPNPFLRSLEVWQKVKALKIPMIRGNHEDYIASYHSGDRPEIRTLPQFMPTQVVAQHLGPEIAREFAALPFDYTVEGPNGDDLYICHASPLHNAKSFIRGVDPNMAATIDPIRAKTIVAGHIHNQWTGTWQGRQLIICGSVGLPHHGKPEAQYAILSHTQGTWQRDLRRVPYDFKGAIREYTDSGALERGGPIARLLVEELRHAEPRIFRFLPQFLAQNGDKAPCVEALASAVESFLRAQ